MSPRRLGLMMCRAVPRMARRTNTLAAATYAHPRKGFLPPIHETVEMTKDFVPLYGRTGKLRPMMMRYVPLDMFWMSFLPYNFVNVGKPAVRIQF